MVGKKDGRKAKGKRKRSSGKAGIRAAATIKKMGEALDYRLQGYTFEEIGEALGLKTTRAYELVTMALDATIEEKAEKVRAMELKRLDKMQPEHLKAAQQGDPKAADVVLKIMDRRARLLGLDAPDKHEHTGKEGGPIETKVDGDTARSALAAALAQAGLASPAPEGDQQPSG